MFHCLHYNYRKRNISDKCYINGSYALTKNCITVFIRKTLLYLMLYSYYHTNGVFFYECTIKKTQTI